MIERLRASIGDKSGKQVVREIASLPAQLDDAELGRRIRVAPGCYIAFIGGALRGGDSAIIDTRFAVYVLTQSDNEKDRRVGSKTQAGAFVILLLVIAQLHGFTIPGVGTLIGQEVNNLFAEALDEKGVTLFAVIFTIPIDVPSASPAALNALVTLHADWLFGTDPAPGTEIPLPAPGADSSDAANAADTLSLPQGDG